MVSWTSFYSPLCLYTVGECALVGSALWELVIWKQAVVPDEPEKQISHSKNE